MLGKIDRSGVIKSNNDYKYEVMIIINRLSTLMMLIRFIFSFYELSNIRIYLIDKYFYGLVQLVIGLAKVFYLLHIVDDG